MATEVQALFTELHAALEQENYQKAVDLSNKIRAKAPNDADAIRVKCQSLLRLGKFDKALEVAAKVPELKVEQAYCLYKLQRVQDALNVISTFPEPKTKSVLHLEAQAHYRLNNYDACISIYEGLLSSAAATDDTTELKTNLLAVYVAAGRGSEIVRRSLDAEGSYEVAFNKSLAALQAKDNVGATEQLAQAEQLCRETLASEGYSPEEIEQEAKIIHVQEAYVAQLSGDNERALETYRQVAKSESDLGLVAVALNNIACVQKDSFDSLKRLRAISKEKCTPSQHQAILANTALLLSHMNKPDEARAVVASLAASAPHSPFLPPLLLHLESDLAALVETLKENKSPEGYLHLAHVYSVLGHPSKAADAIRQISAIQHTPGTVATLVALYNAAQDTKSAEQVTSAALQHASSSAVLLEGDGVAKLSKGQYADAAAAFTRLLDGGSDLEPESRVRCLAYLVIALSFVDPTQAVERAVTLPDVTPSDQPLLDLVKRAPRPKAAVVAALTPKEKKKRAENRERVLRKRAKRKALFIASLKAKPDYNPLIGLVNPDPERWIPRKQRSRRGRKNRNKFVGAQGAGMATQKDALKLDVAARAAAKKAAPATEKGVLVTDGPSMNRKARKRR
ncbi:unnamed protein product [Aphanomyces euteiches]